MELPAMAVAFGLTWTPLAIQVPAAVPVAPVASPAASSVFDATGAVRTWDEALDDLAAARVIAVGERHDDEGHHTLQAETLSGLAARLPRLAVAFEMVDYEQQAFLDSFLSGATSELDFALWWNSTWGYDYLLYKPIFDAARAANVPAYGLNAPRALVKAVSKGGLASLSASDRARLPSSVQESSDARYRAYVEKNVSGHGPLTPDQLKNRLEAMAVWNETMGDRIAAIAAGGRAVLVIAGEGHVLYNAGLIESATRRGAGPAKTLLPSAGAPNADDLSLADWFRVVP